MLVLLRSHQPLRGQTDLVEVRNIFSLVTMMYNFNNHWTNAKIGLFILFCLHTALPRLKCLSKSSLNQWKSFTVSNARQAIDLMSFVHEKVLSGLTINAALKLTKKDRKTVDRFRNIYYLHVLDCNRLKQVSSCVRYYYYIQ